jgi:hypothetical protein
VLNFTIKHATSKVRPLNYKKMSWENNESRKLTVVDYSIIGDLKDFDAVVLFKRLQQYKNKCPNKLKRVIS